MTEEPTEKSIYGIDELNFEKSPSDRLYEQIRERIHQGHERWEKRKLISANRLRKEVKLNRGTVTRVLERLTNEGFLEPHQGKGYRIVSNEAEPRATTLVSISEFCRKNDLECVSLLDVKACRAAPLRELESEIGGDPEKRQALQRAIQDRLKVDDSDPVLFIRRARGWRKQGTRDKLTWAILETLFLVETKCRKLEGTFKSQLESLDKGGRKALGNLSLHKWMSSNLIELERSEYGLTLSSLYGKDAQVWNALQPKPPQTADDTFIRLQAVTYGKGMGALLFTVEHLVPSLFDLRVSGFQLRLSRSGDGA